MMLARHVRYECRLLGRRGSVRRRRSQHLLRLDKCPDCMGIPAPPCRSPSSAKRITRWRAEGDTWVTAVDDVELRAQVFVGDGAVVSAAPYLVDGNLQPVHRLTVEMPPSRTARIIWVGENIALTRIWGMAFLA